ncbi:MAG: methyl-accepting chemotaxis protein [Candidatus Hodarchaeales archaeon]|jgi:methyl-accepting chemotaxis protein
MEKNVTSSVASSSSAIYFTLIGVLITTLPMMSFIMLQTMLFPSTDTSSSVATTPALLMTIFVIYLPPQMILLFIIFWKIFSSLELKDQIKMRKQAIKYRKVFQLFYIPITILITAFFMAALYFAVYSADQEFFTFVLNGSSYPFVFNITGLLIIEYMLDRKMVPIMSRSLTEGEVEIVNTLSLTQKYFMSCTYALVGLFLYTYNQYISTTITNFAERVPLLGLIFLIPFVTIIVFYFLTEPKLKQINKDISQALSKEAISNENIAVTSLDDIGNLVQMYNAMINKLTQTITTTQVDLSQHLSASADNVASRSEEINGLSEAIAATIQQMNRGAQQQAEQINETIRNVEELSAIAEKTTQDIASTVDLIADVASQTNMLSLNAQIEAARAGDFGKSFMVVADNVRRLAEDTKASTISIQDLVVDIQQQISGSVNKIAKAVDSVAAVAEETAASSEEASAASEEQTAAINEMTQTAQDLSRLAKEFSEGLNVEYKSKQTKITRGM